MIAGTTPTATAHDRRPLQRAAAEVLVNTLGGWDRT
jgi:hypothetical protein